MDRNKHDFRNTHGKRLGHTNSPGSASSSPSLWQGDGVLDAEREAQRQEFLNREINKEWHRRFAPNASARAAKDFSHSSRTKSGPPVKTIKPQPLTLEQKLELTTQWLEQTFPQLFAADDYLPLDEHIVRDLKTHYKRHQATHNYPPDLIIKAAVSRYKESPGYLSCLWEGEPKYALDGSVSGYVSAEGLCSVGFEYPFV